MLAISGPTDFGMLKFKAELQGIEDTNRLLRNFGTDPVAGQKRDAEHTVGR